MSDNWAAPTDVCEIWLWKWTQLERKVSEVRVRSENADFASTKKVDIFDNREK